MKPLSRAQRWMIFAGFLLLATAFAGGLLWVNELRKGFDQRLAARVVVQGADQRKDTRELQIKLNGTIRCQINGVFVDNCLRRQVVPQAKRQPLPQPTLQARRGIPGIRGPTGPGGVEGRQGRQGQPGRPGRDGRDGVDGAPGRDAPPPTQAQVNAAVASLLPAGSGGVSMAQVEAAIAAYCAAHNECRGPKGERGERGEQGPTGPMGPVGATGPPGETIVQPPPEPTPPPDSTPAPVP